MAIKPAQPEEYAEAQQFLRAEVRVPRTEARNTAIAAEVNADSYFTYNGVAYKVPPLGYAIGVQLQEVQFMIADLSRTEEASKELEDLLIEQKVEHLLKLKACYEQAVDLFWKASTPQLWWKRRRHKKVNPFLEASAKEVGELLGFFFTCRTKSRVHIVGTLANRPSLSMLTQQTT